MSSEDQQGTSMSKAQTEEEFNIFDLLRMIVQRKWWIIGLTLLVTAFGGLHILLREPIYQYRQLFQIANYQQDNGAKEPVQSPKDLMTRIQLVTLPELIKQFKSQHPNVPIENPKVSSKNNTLMEIQIKGPYQYHKAYADLFEQFGQKLKAYQDHHVAFKRSAFKERLKRAEDILKIQLQLEKSLVERNQSLKSHSEVYPMLLATNILLQQNHKIDLMSRIEANKTYLATLENTQEMTSVSTSALTTPWKNTLLSYFIIGLISSLLLVLLFEILRKTWEHHQIKQNIQIITKGYKWQSSL